MNVVKFDVVIPTRKGVNRYLLSTLKKSIFVNNIKITFEKPLSVARKNAILNCETDYVVMFDDDIIIPINWFSVVSKHLTDNKIGAVTTVAKQKNIHIDAYEKTIKCFKDLNSIDTAPHINNIIIKKDLLINYNPPKIFSGEDLCLKKHIIKSGYKWKTIKNIGVIHTGTSKNILNIGMAYKQFNQYTKKQLLKRFVAKTVFIPYTFIFSHKLTTVYFLTKQNVKFYSGYVKKWLN